MIRFPSSLEKVILVKRTKRFIVDVRRNDRPYTVHCANSGSMKTCFEPGWDGYISDSGNPDRKYRHTLELVHNGSSFICVNTGMANRIAFQAMKSGHIPELKGYSEYRREVPFGEHTRFDAAAFNSSETCYIEVKSVSLCRNGIYNFPDAVTVRGQKHLKELMKAADLGRRAVMLYILMRNDGDGFEPASDIDPEYGRLFSEAARNGVEILIYKTIITVDGILLGERLL